jgi:hypothetical protein
MKNHHSIDSCSKRIQLISESFKITSPLSYIVPRLRRGTMFCEESLVAYRHEAEAILDTSAMITIEMKNHHSTDSCSKANELSENSLIRGCNLLE